MQITLSNKKNPNSYFMVLSGKGKEMMTLTIICLAHPPPEYHTSVTFTLSRPGVGKLQTNLACFLCLNQVSLGQSHVHLFTVVYGCFCTKTAELGSCKRPYGPRSLENLLSSLLLKKFANHCCRESWNLGVISDKPVFFSPHIQSITIFHGFCLQNIS